MKPPVRINRTFIIICLCMCVGYSRKLFPGDFTISKLSYWPIFDAVLKFYKKVLLFQISLKAKYCSSLENSVETTISITSTLHIATKPMLNPIKLHLVE